MGKLQYISNLGSFFLIGVGSVIDVTGSPVDLDLPPQALVDDIAVVGSDLTAALNTAPETIGPLKPSPQLELALPT